MQFKHRRLVPFTAFSEYEGASPKGAKVIRWFAPPERGMYFFAGIASEYYGDYGAKKEPNEGAHKLFSFLTTEANDLVRPVHAEASRRSSGANSKCRQCLNSAPEQIETIQARVMPASALEIVPDEEAAKYAGGYLK